MKRLLTGTGLTIVLFVPAVASAQILVAGEGPVVYGHHHLNTTNMDAQKKFFADTLGGIVVKIGSGDRQQEIIQFPNVLIFFRPMQAPTGGSIGTTVNHIGFSVPDLRPLVAKIKANGFKMITADSVAANVKVTGDIAAASPTTNLAFALGPEDVKVEFVEVKSQKAPIQLHHVHFFGQMNTEMQAWYAKTFGATMLPANPGSAFVQDQLPGVSLNFSPSPTPTVGTTGRAIDHIGFEIKNLEAFTKKLEAQGIKLDRPYTKVPQLGIAIAFIKDPWGTNIEMTEGLAGLNRVTSNESGYFRSGGAGVMRAPPAFAQLVSHADAPVRIGHYHLNVTSIEAHKKFWAGTLGGKAMKFGGIDVIEFPDAFIFLRVQKPAGPTRGTAFDHIGFAVPNVPAMATKLAAAGYQETTGREPKPGEPPPAAAGTSAVYGRFAYFLGPDGVKIELVTSDQKPGDKKTRRLSWRIISTSSTSSTSRCSSGT